MDVADIDFNDTATITLVHPVYGHELKDDDGNVMTVTIYGAQSDEYRKALVEVSRNRVIDGARESNDGDEAALEIMKRLIIDWNIQFRNEHIECNAENIEKVLTERAWVRRQIDKHIHEASNFLAEPLES